MRTGFFSLLICSLFLKKNPPRTGHLEFILSTSWSARRETKKKKKNAWDLKRGMWQGMGTAVSWWPAERILACLKTSKHPWTFGIVANESHCHATYQRLAAWEKVCGFVATAQGVGRPSVSPRPLSELSGFRYCSVTAAPGPVYCYSSFQ